MIDGTASTTIECQTGEPLTAPGIVKGRPQALQWWDHQRRWFEDHSRLRVCCKARQIGMSTAVATEALHAAVYGETTVIVSASQRQASELLRKAVQLLPLVTVAAEGAVWVAQERIKKEFHRRGAVELREAPFDQRRRASHRLALPG